MHYLSESTVIGCTKVVVTTQLHADSQNHYTKWKKVDTRVHAV